MVYEKLYTNASTNDLYRWHALFGEIYRQATSPFDTQRVRLHVDAINGEIERRRALCIPNRA